MSVDRSAGDASRDGSVHRTESREFVDRFNGRFVGLRRWDDFDALLDSLRGAPDGWYVSMTGEALPVEPVPAESFLAFLDEISALLRRDHAYDYCGIVYVDDRDKPEMVKIYDPNNLGTSCGTGSRRVMPRWVVSRCVPAPIEAVEPTPGNRLRWWRRLFAGG